MIFFLQKLFLLLFYITKLQYKPPGTKKVCLSPPPILALARFEMFREIRELFEAVIEEHEESLDESDPRHCHTNHRSGES